MMQKLKAFLIGGVLTGMLAMNALVVMTPSTTSAVACNNVRLLTFPAWYSGISRGNTPNCDIVSPTAVGGIQTFIFRIALNIIEILLQLVAYASVAFLMFGGFLYMAAVGDSSGLAKAKSTIKNALIGLIISIGSVAVVTFIGQNIT